MEHPLAYYTQLSLERSWLNNTLNTGVLEGRNCIMMTERQRVLRRRYRTYAARPLFPHPVNVDDDGVLVEARPRYSHFQATDDAVLER